MRTGIAAALPAQQRLQLGHPCFRGCTGRLFLPTGCRFLRETRLRRLPHRLLALPRLVGFRKVRQILSGRRIVEPQQTTQ